MDRLDAQRKKAAVIDNVLPGVLLALSLLILYVVIDWIIVAVDARLLPWYEITWRAGERTKLHLFWTPMSAKMTATDLHTESDLSFRHWVTELSSLLTGSLNKIADQHWNTDWSPAATLGTEPPEAHFGYLLSRILKIRQRVGIIFKLFLVAIPISYGAMLVWVTADRKRLQPAPTAKTKRTQMIVGAILTASIGAIFIAFGILFAKVTDQFHYFLDILPIFYTANTGKPYVDLSSEVARFPPAYYRIYCIGAFFLAIAAVPLVFAMLQWPKMERQEENQEPLNANST